MGDQNVNREQSTGEVRAFTKALLADVRALEKMLDAGMFEKDVRRIGAEQEMFLIDRDLFPANMALEVLEELGRDDVGTELATFNLEANVPPRVFSGDCLRRMEDDLGDVVARVRAAAAGLGVDVVLTGILPTLNQSHLGLENITPNPRYLELNEAIRNLRRGDFRISLKGLDELQITHDNVLVESCNTSFQIHFQVASEEFARFYNQAQAVAAPVLAAAVNSPVFLGKRLWKETRVGLFQHSVDTRADAHHSRGAQPRVDMGNNWVNESVLELIREDIAHFRVLLTKGLEEDSLRTLADGGIPRLDALCLHNGTVYRWNRFCYGITAGKPHLRIEARFLPAGPTVIDEVANASFFFGLMAGVAEEHDDIRRVMSFDDVRSNFFAVARHGLKAQIVWDRGRTHTAESLILKVLLPTAREGLRHAGIDSADIDRYLGVIEERVRHHRTGARWILDSLATMGDEGTADLRYRTLTAAMVERQKTGDPVHRWPLASLDEARDWRYSFLRVGQVMSTQVFTVRPGDLVEMVANLMDWNGIRYVPVEDDDGRLCGLVGYGALIRLVGHHQGENDDGGLTVADIMRTDLITVTPETSTAEAIRLVRAHQIGCLPVVKDGYLAGVLTAADFLPLFDKLIDEMLKEDGLDER
jgi:CBS domain-containing protein